MNFHIQDEEIDADTHVIELGDVATETKGGVEHMIEDRDPLV